MSHFAADNPTTPSALPPPLHTVSETSTASPSYTVRVQNIDHARRDFDHRNAGSAAASPQSPAHPIKTEDTDGGRLKAKQKRNKPTLSCEECVERKTKVCGFGDFFLTCTDSYDSVIVEGQHVLRVSRGKAAVITLLWQTFSIRPSSSQG